MVIFAQLRGQNGQFICLRYRRKRRRNERGGRASMPDSVRPLPSLAFYFAEGDRFQFHSSDLVRIDDLDAPDLLFKD